METDHEEEAAGGKTGTGRASKVSPSHHLQSVSAWKSRPPQQQEVTGVTLNVTMKKSGLPNEMLSLWKYW
jgi:hypothetical protein